MKKGRKERLGLLTASLVALFAIAMPAGAAPKDGNRDGIPDRWEQAHGLSLKRNQAKLDQDRDGLRNRGEWRNSTDPRDRDTDDDGTPDGREVEQGSDPKVPHPWLPTEDVGQIAAWDAETGQLEVAFTAGGSVSGTVSEFTRIRCPLPPPPTDQAEEDDSTDDSDDSRRRPPAGPGAAGEPGSAGRPGSGLHPGHGPSLRCTSADLAVGVPVRAVDVRYTADGATFIGIALGGEVEPPVEDPVTP